MKKKRHEPTWVPQPQDYDQTFLEQNPWHLDKKVPDEWARPVERPLAKYLWKRLLVDKPRRFQIIWGPRRVGKTTSMYQTVRHLLDDGIPPRRLWWLRLDHPLLMRVPLEDLVRIILEVSQASADRPVFFFLDELTYAEEWDLWLKTFYDQSLPIRLAGSSSSTAALKKRKYESGVGRWEEQYLAPYLFNEYLDLIGRPVAVPVETSLATTLRACMKANLPLEGLADLRRRFLLTGGFPELLIADKEKPENEASVLLHSQRTLRSDAVERAVYKDIPQAFGVDNPMLLERLLYTLAGQFTGILSPNTLCQSLGGMTQPTFDHYLSYLEHAFLVFTLPNYSGSESAVQKRGRKLYFIDGAVRNAALQRGIAPLSDYQEMGLLLENLAASHLHALSRQSQVRIYHWREKDEEVDLIYDHPECPLAFEIGSSEKHRRRGLTTFIARFPRFKGGCYFVSPNVIAASPESHMDGIGTLPLDLFLLAVGASAERELAKNLAAETDSAG